jgi:hypothetical protein
MSDAVRQLMYDNISRIKSQIMAAEAGTKPGIIKAAIEFCNVEIAKLVHELLVGQYCVVVDVRKQGLSTQVFPMNFVEKVTAIGIIVDGCTYCVQSNAWFEIDTTMRTVTVQYDDPAINTMRRHFTPINVKFGDPSVLERRFPRHYHPYPTPDCQELWERNDSLIHAYNGYINQFEELGR